MMSMLVGWLNYIKCAGMIFKLLNSPRKAELGV